jgi:hypothetical protein
MRIAGQMGEVRTLTPDQVARLEELAARLGLPRQGGRGAEAH